MRASRTERGKRENFPLRNIETHFKIHSGVIMKRTGVRCKIRKIISEGRYKSKHKLCKISFKKVKETFFILQLRVLHIELTIENQFERSGEGTSRCGKCM